MRPIPAPITLLENLRALLHAPAFVGRHRTHDAAFTRVRLLPFATCVLLVLQKTLKSLQLHLQEWAQRLGTGAAATPGAWTQARAKLRHPALIELNTAAVLPSVYASGQPAARWRGLRLLGLDSSTLRLPTTEELWAHFGGQEPSNAAGPCGGRVVQARLSVLYDVLERVALDAVVGAFHQGEVALGTSQLPHLGPGDLVLIDRGYCGWEFFARIVARGADFVGRCPRRSFGPAQQLFARDQAGQSVIVRLSAPRAAQARLRAEGLPVELSLRLVSVRLSTGELEVLATSLREAVAWPVSVFLETYGQRWGIETYYHGLKSPLTLENWSGQTVEAILQDIHAAVLLSNLESVLTRPAAADLPQAGEGRRRHPAQINRAVSIHALKSRLWELLLGAQPLSEVLAELRVLFAANPVSVRPHRSPPRPPPSPLRSLHFQKHVRKMVF